MQMTFIRPWAPHILSILRILAAATFITHGTMKLFGWPAPFPFPLNGLLYFAGDWKSWEAFCSLLDFFRDL